MKVVEYSSKDFDRLKAYLDTQKKLYKIGGYLNRVILGREGKYKTFIVENETSEIRGFAVCRLPAKETTPIRIYYAWCSDEQAARELGKAIKEFAKRRGVVAKANKSSLFNYWFSIMGMELIDQQNQAKYIINVWGM